jgi:hypothetical protein
MDSCPTCNGSGKKITDTCLWCDRLATVYCDAVIGCIRPDIIDSIDNVTMLTCDAPMCNKHRRKVGHVCGEDPDTIDRCPAHANSNPPRWREIREQAAAAEIRRQVSIDARRSRIARV